MSTNATPNPASPPVPAPSTVWVTAQQAPAAQRKGRYHSDSTAHPAKMLPAIAAHAITHYTHPGDLVFDPMCGIGTTLVEALHLGRRALGNEYEARWADIARTNIELARSAGCDQAATVYTGDARKLATTLPAEYLGAVDLIITSPPYGAATHGQVKVIPGQGVHKTDYRYGSALDRGNLANVGLGRLLSGFTRILTACATYLRPGGHIVITARPWREHTELVDLPSHLLTCAALAGLEPVERCVALLGRVAESELVAHSSFFQRDLITKKRAAGLPVQLIAHEDVLVLEKFAGHRNTGQAPYDWVA
ncbi:TRM11 family SAM-dependent methyltransferase [Nocardia sp. CDC160]|uniref:TRM11 family SAM-dependent methyltransferase n=1 Tax=Nocardia sp. CDC160 TaxID=3112166 RepID=UPI002DBF9BDA|nr:DNA methyltransferase [Nocardia sp. CDC160]MEC3915516.1 DNA methyltransferase [Nocardia sp. CDC160]